MEKEYFMQSEPIEYAVATAAGLLNKEIILNSAYDQCVGVAICESNGGGISFFRMGLSDKDGQFISAVHKDMLKSAPEVGMDIANRFFPVNIKANGHKVFVNTQIPEVTTEKLQYDVVFLLARNKKRY